MILRCREEEHVTEHGYTWRASRMCSEVVATLIVVIDIASVADSLLITANHCLAQCLIHRRPFNVTCWV